MSERKAILVVEDEDKVRSFVRLYLEHEGYRVIEAGNGREALRVLESRIPDLIVLDIEMPVMDGVSFYTALRDLPQGRKIPVVIVTVRDDSRDIQYAHLLGVDAYITKPFDPNELVGTIRRLLGE